MYSYQILSELGNLGLAFADTRLVASDGASVRVHWPLLLARGVWWTAAACADQEHDGDRVIIFSNVTISELRQFVSSIYCEYPCCGWSSFDIPLKTEAESEDDDIECEYTVHWGAGHQGPAEAGTVPLGLVAAPSPALSGDSECVLAVSKFQCGDCGKYFGTNKKLHDHKPSHTTQ